MSTIRRITLEELKAMPPLSEEERKIINKARPIESEDCPFMTRKELEQFHRVGSMYRPTKSHVTLRLDNDIISIFKAEGKGYQTRINNALREYISEHPEMLRP